jgi:hypothetical protein
MNTFDRTPRAQPEYRPILRVQESTEREAGQPECECPEFCQIDHGN